MTAIILAVLVCSTNGFGLRKTTVLLAWLSPTLGLSVETPTILLHDPLLGMSLTAILLLGLRTLIGGGTLKPS